MRALLIAAVLLFSRLALASDPPAPPPSGTFSGEGLTLTLKRDGDSYTGTAKVGDRSYDLKGTLDPSKGLQGTFSVGGNEYRWSATVNGQTLVFETGGSEYKLALPAPDNPLARKPTPENPLARKPDAPAPPKGAPVPAPEGALKFTRISIRDPGINNIEAVSLLIPSGWKTEGGITWFHDYSVLANLLLTVTDPDTGAQIQFLPLQNFTWMDNPVVPMQPGTNYMGNIVHQPVRDVPELIRVFYTREALPHLRGAAAGMPEDLKKIAEQVGQAYGGAARVVSQKVRYEFERNGKPWQEDVYATIVSTTMQGNTIWSVTSAYSFRAPKSDFDRLAPRMAATVGSARVTQDWFGGYMYVQKLFMDRMNQGIRNARAISDTVTRNSEEIRQMFSDSYRKQSESQDRISRQFGEYIRGVETYTNPYESRPVQLPSGYSNAWVNASGEYLLSPQAGFDPNVGSTVEWRRMEQAK